MVFRRLQTVVQVQELHSWKLHEGGRPDSHQEFSLHLLSVLHVETSRLVHSNCLLLLAQPSCQRLLASTSKQHGHVTLSECGKSQPTPTYLAVGSRLRRSTAAGRDAVVSFKATVCEGEQNAYPCKPTCRRHSERIIVWEAVNRLWWTDNVTARWTPSKTNLVKLNVQLFKLKPFSKYATDFTMTQTVRKILWVVHTYISDKYPAHKIQTSEKTEDGGLVQRCPQFKSFISAVSEMSHCLRFPV